MNAFIITPFDVSGQRVADCVKMALHTVGVSTFYFSGGFSSSAVTESILEHIRKADLVFCDISRQNANVFYELGFAHALRKDVILLRSTQADKEIPLDLQGFLYLVYDSSNLSSLRDQVRFLAIDIVKRKGGNDD
ncbi:MAG: hypothetical protein JXA96_08455 [Sedimentisphaerales bacterium]|nr:hypothetical protein [Sedimentisphaerales bacterium]